MSSNQSPKVIQQSSKCCKIVVLRSSKNFPTVIPKSSNCCPIVVQRSSNNFPKVIQPSSNCCPIVVQRSSSNFPKVSQTSSKRCPIGVHMPSNSCPNVIRNSSNCCQLGVAYLMCRSYFKSRPLLTALFVDSCFAQWRRRRSLALHPSGLPTMNPTSVAMLLKLGRAKRVVNPAVNSRTSGKHQQPIERSKARQTWQEKMAKPASRQRQMR